MNLTGRNATIVEGVALVALAFLGACALLGSPKEPDPAAAAYGAERGRCVERFDEADAARACMHEVDVRYAHDGGRK